MKWLPLILVLALPLCTSCTPKNAPRGDGRGVMGFIEANFDNVRARCNFQDQGNHHYQTVCVAVAINHQGNEVLATQIASGVQLNWLDPQKVFGADIQNLSCSAISNGLSQRCHFSLNNGEPTKVLFQLDVVDTLQPRKKTESDTLLLPFSAISYGIVPQLLNYLTMSTGLLSETQGMGEKVGFQTLGLDPLTSLIMAPNSLCIMKDKLFFSAENFVYVLQENSLKIYAGSSNQANTNELSHRLRIAFSAVPVDGSSRTDYSIYIACGSDKLYVSDPSNYRILLIPENGPVRIVAGVTGAKGYSPDGILASEAKLMGRGLPIALGPDDSLYLNDLDTNGNTVRKINPTIGTLSGFVTISRKLGSVKPNRKNASRSVKRIIAPVFVQIL